MQSYACKPSNIQQFMRIDAADNTEYNRTEPSIPPPTFRGENKSHRIHNYLARNRSEKIAIWQDQQWSRTKTIERVIRQTLDAVNKDLPRSFNAFVRRPCCQTRKIQRLAHTHSSRCQRLSDRTYNPAQDSPCECVAVRVQNAVDAKKPRIAIDLINFQLNAPLHSHAKSSFHFASLPLGHFAIQFASQFAILPVASQMRRWLINFQQMAAAATAANAHRKSPHAHPSTHPTIRTPNHSDPKRSKKWGKQHGEVKSIYA